MASEGLAVLIAVVSVGVFFLVMLGWFVLALVLRWRFQFSIRSLLVLVVAVALPFSWLATEMKAAGKQRELVGWVENVGYVYYHYEPDPFGKPVAQPPSPAWLAELFGENFFADVTAVFFRGEISATSGWNASEDLCVQVALPQLHPGQRRRAGTFKEFTGLRVLNLDNTNVTDAGLAHLRGFTQLQELQLDNTQVSDAGLVNLQGLANLNGCNSRAPTSRPPAGTPQGIDATERLEPSRTQRSPMQP